MKNILLFWALFLSISSSAQYVWTWELLPEMPESISNNAVAEGTVDGNPFVYTFSGIDSTKASAGISLTSMRLDVDNGDWSYIPALPDTLGKIAAAASTVNNIIYVIGGYHVFEDFPFELSSNKVHRFDPQSNSYLSDGSDLPFAIDDQVQAVWRDSLIYVVTGWSDTQNVEYVQIYNPSLDEWQLGSPVPNGSVYEAFGASGTIIGDTIFYYGGAVGFNFNGSRRLRKGVIDPNNPTSITWSDEGFSPGDRGYRAASLTIDGVAFWIGGSGVTYNFDGIAYNGSGGVSPLHRILSYNPSDGSWGDQLGQAYGIMDLRNIAQISDNQFVICGGMEENQMVSNKTFLLTYGGTSSLDETERIGYTVYPNPVRMDQTVNIQSIRPYATQVNLFDQRGAVLGSLSLNPGFNSIAVSDLDLNAGVYVLREEGAESTYILIIN